MGLRAVEELAGERDHAVHEVGFDEHFVDLAFAGLARRNAAVGEDESRPCPAARGGG